MEFRKGRFFTALCGTTLALTMTASVMAMPISAVAPTAPVSFLGPAVPAPATLVDTAAKMVVDAKGGATPVSTPTAATVKPKISQDEAIKIAQDTFSIAAEFGTPSVNYWSNEKPTLIQTYNIAWRNPNPLTSVQENFNVEIDANTGLIRGFYHYRYDPANPNKTPQLTREEALPKAEGWLKKIQPKNPAELRLEVNFQDPIQAKSNLMFRWTRMVNGIPFPEDSVNITIDPVDGSLSNYNCSWTADAVFPAADKVKDLAAAQEAYDKSADINLIYQRFYQAMGEPDFRLVYQVGTYMIDAETLNIVDASGQARKDPPKPVQLPTSDKQLTKLETRLDKEGALALVRATLGDLIKGDPNNVSFNENEDMAMKMGGSRDKVGVWYFNWQINTDDKGSYQYVNAAVDADYGVIMNFSRDPGMWIPDEQFKDKTPVEEAVARQTAIDFLVKTRPDLLRQVRLLDRSVIWTGPVPLGEPRPVQREYNFNFERVIGDGVLVSGDQINIVVDRFSGQVRNMWTSWTRKEFAAPKAEQLITRDQIKGVVNQEMPLELQYRRLWSGAEGQPAEIKLAYSPVMISSNIFDAVTGHLLDWSGRDLSEARKPITDIADHPYKREIEQMITRNVFTIKDGLFNPQGTLTRGEIAKAILTAVGQDGIAMKMAAEFTRSNAAPSYNDVSYDNAYYAYIEYAVRNGIFQPATADDKFNVDAKVSNEEFALYVARAMGYGEIAKMKPAIEIGYTDQAQIKADNHNAVGLLIGLEVLDGKGEFKPAIELTRADAAKILAIASQKVIRNRYYY